MAIIECGEWLPDQPNLGNPGATIAQNCLPAPRGFKPFPSPSVLSDALDSRPLGAHSGTDSDGDPHSYAGNDTKIYSLTGAAWTDISKAGGYTNTATRWDFDSYGAIEIATNFVDSPQFVDMDSGSPVMADLTTAFRARTVATVRDFVVFGNTYDATDGNVPQRLRWSAIGDYTDYTISATTQSDFQDTPNGGIIQRVFGGEYGIVFFERAIIRMSYIGSPVVFQFDDVSPEKGLYAPGAAAQSGDDIFFLDNGGFYVISGGQTVTAIGNEKVDNWFFNELDGTQKDRITCAIDYENKVVSWSFPSTASTSGKPDTIICFNFKIGRWSYAKIDNDMVFSSLSVGFTLETLDSLSSDLDTLNISLDSRIFFKGNKVLGLFDSFTLHVLAGSALEATIETKEMQMASNSRSLITEAIPLVDGGTTTIALGTRNRQQDDVVWGANTSINTVGFAPMRSEGRYVRARIIINGIWQEAQGIDVQGGGSGNR